MPTQRRGTGRSATFVDAEGVTGQYAQQVEIIYSNVASSTYPTSDLRYQPVEKVASPDEEYFEVQFRATRSGILNLVASYAPSVDDPGDMVFTPSWFTAGDGDSPDGARTTDPNITLTPGAGQTRKTFALDTGVAVVEGDDVSYRLTRADVVGDNHPGSFNLIDLLVTVEDA